MVTCPQCHSGCDDAHRFCPACGSSLAQVATKTVDDPLIGKTLPGGYVILDLVGIGGMGRVYRAEQTNLGRTVAVKVIHPYLVGEENAAARFITEARASSRLNHPNSVGVIDFGKTDDGQLYLVMEFLRGKDLARVLYDDGPLSFRRIVDILRQVLAALAEAHHLDIIHRDLKPENIILEQVRSGGDFVKVVDFGLAKMRMDTHQPGITSPGIVCGTPEYMSPEQGRGDPIDGRSDLYAVGVILFQLLTGVLPFEGETATQVVLRHLTEDAPDPRTIAPERAIPQVLVDVCMTALEKKASSRYASAEEFSGALTEALAQLSTSSRVRATDELVIRCPSCAAVNGASQRFCGECGAALVSPSGHPLSQSRPSVPPPASQAAHHGETPKAPPTDPGSSREVLPLPFVGRTDELAWLEDRRHDADTLLLGARIVADVGMGKTRLLSEFARSAVRHGDFVVRCGPHPTYAEVGYHALRQAITALADLPPHGGEPASWVAAGSEAKRGLFDVFDRARETGSALLAADVLRFAVAEALRWAIGRAADRVKDARVTILVDDLHLVDNSSRNAFADVVAEPPFLPSLLVVAYPPGHDPGWPPTPESARVLVGLPMETVSKLVSGAPTPSASMGGRGIAPLYVEQLLRLGREQGGRAPSRLADIIALRVERLAPAARRVLQAIAVYGDIATTEVVAHMVASGTDVARSIAQLAAAGMVEVEDEIVRCAHPLVRDVVLTTIPAAVRKELHEAAAEIGETYGLPLEARALHEMWAQHSFQALILLEQVSKRCRARGDMLGAIDALRRSLELARRELFRGELDDPLRAVLLFSRKLGEALTDYGDFTDAAGVLGEALDLAGPNAPERARVLGALAQLESARANDVEAERYMDEAMGVARASGSHDLMLTLEDLRRAMTD